MGSSLKPKVEHTDNSMEFGKACLRTSTPHRSDTNGIAERAVGRVKEGTSAVLLQSRLDEMWWSDSMECYCNLRHVQDLLADRKTPHERRFGDPFKGPIIPFGALGEYHPIRQEFSNWQESITRYLSRIWIYRGENLERRHSDRRFGRFGEVGRIRNLSAKTHCERSTDITKRKWIHIPGSRRYSKIARKRPRIPRTHCQAGTNRKERRFQWTTSRRTRRSLNQIESRDDAEARADFLSIQGDVIYRHHNECAEGRNIPYSTEIHWCD